VAWTGALAALSLWRPARSRFTPRGASAQTTLCTEIAMLGRRLLLRIHAVQTGCGTWTISIKPFLPQNERWALGGREH